MRKEEGEDAVEKAIQSFPLYLEMAPQISSINHPFPTHSQWFEWSQHNLPPSPRSRGMTDPGLANKYILSLW